MTTTSAFLQLNLPAKLLRDLTNYDGSSSSTDTTFLADLADEAEGVFQTFTGIALDVDVKMHQRPYKLCFLLCVEESKDRGIEITNAAEAKAKSACSSLKRLVSVSPQTTSPLTTDVPDKDDAYPDMGMPNFNKQPSSIINERGKSARYVADSPST